MAETIMGMVKSTGETHGGTYRWCDRPCRGILDYIYSTLWTCRSCGKWHSIVPKA